MVVQNLEVHLAAVDADGVGEGEQIRHLLGAGDPGDACDGKNIALGDSAIAKCGKHVR